jgi:hypothetical protein
VQFSGIPRGVMDITYGIWYNIGISNAKEVIFYVDDNSSAGRHTYIRYSIGTEINRVLNNRNIMNNVISMLKTASEAETEMIFKGDHIVKFPGTRNEIKTLRLHELVLWNDIITLKQTS